MGSVRDLVQTTSNGTREVIFTFTPDNWEANLDSIPRWSLHRLIEMLANSGYYYGGLAPIEYNNAFDGLIDDIEKTIKEGYFNKEYLD